MVWLLRKGKQKSPYMKGGGIVLRYSGCHQVIKFVYKLAAEETFGLILEGLDLDP